MNDRKIVTLLSHLGRPIRQLWARDKDGLCRDTSAIKGFVSYPVIMKKLFLIEKNIYNMGRRMGKRIYFLYYDSTCRDCHFSFRMEMQLFFHRSKKCVWVGPLLPFIDNNQPTPCKKEKEKREKNTVVSFADRPGLSREFTRSFDKLGIMSRYR